ncbi:MAG: LapA family protein [Proteobacteria bacterium]|nr:LapA family protein [Pseudomonadota bacterium]MBU2227761.1 LapA family protein [Pseudomonadota bacterium]
MNYKKILIILLAGLAFLFIIQNMAVVEIQFLFWSVALSRSLVILLLLAVGIAIGWFLHSFINHRRE